MSEPYLQDQNFDKNFSPAKGEYDHCTFTGCDLAEVDLGGYRFVDCTFTGCNLSLAKLQRTAFREVLFKDCKMLGLRFDTCHELGLSVSFEGCQLNHASFYKLKLKNTRFVDSNLSECDFTECDLSGALFDHCNLELAVFDQTRLEKADFRTAYNYNIDLERNRVKGARFSLAGVGGLLGKYGVEIDG